MSGNEKKASDTIEKMIIGLFVSLVLRAAFQAAFEQVDPKDVDKHGLLATVLGVLWSAPMANVIAFIVTLVRFIFGAYRLGDEPAVRDGGPKKRIWNMVAPIVLFGGFYVTGVWVSSPPLFYSGIVVVHAWDLLWLIVLAVSSRNELTERARKAVASFVVLDVMTAFSASALVFSCRMHTLPGEIWGALIGLALMALLAALDFVHNADFFFGVPKKPAAMNRKLPGRSVYLAGPLFTQGEWAWNERLGLELRNLGLSVILPQATATPMLSGHEEFDPARLFDQNCCDIQSCDVLVAVLDQPDADSGTCWECGYAYQLGKPIIGLRTDLRGTGEERGVNLMLSRSCIALIIMELSERTDVAEAARRVVQAMPA